MTVRTRLIGAAIALLAVIVAGTLGYFIFGRGDWDLESCFYMTVITLTTVGFGEVLPGFDQVEHVRTFTVLLIVFGMGTFLYFASTLTAAIIEGDLTRMVRKTRMNKRISDLEDHVIVCGVGTTGLHIVKELMQTGAPTIAIDISAERLESVAAEYDQGQLLYLVGDATDDHILEEANLSKARGLIAALASDKDNLYLVVTARQANPDARIIARAAELQVLEKVKKAGADAVVSPNYIGGMRIVSEMIRPTAVRFLDEMLRDTKTPMRIEDVAVGPGSPFVGKKLRDAQLRETYHVSVLAIEDPKTGDYAYNPDADFELVHGMKLVVMGTVTNVKRLRELADG